MEEEKRKNKTLIKRVLQNKTTKQKYVVLDKSSDFKPGSYVKITEVREE